MKPSVFATQNVIPTKGLYRFSFEKLDVFSSWRRDAITIIWAFVAIPTTKGL